LGALASRRRGGASDPNVQRQVVGADIVEQRAGAFVEHVGIDIFGLEQVDAALPLRALDLQMVQLRRQRRHLAVDILLGLEPVIAAIGVDAEIADQERRRDLEAERIENGTQTPAGNHAASLRRHALRAH
jgi:hypothetical protein